MSLNKVQLIGNLGADVELRFTGTGRPVATLSMATNEGFTDKEGKKGQHTEWHRVVVWGKQAEHCSEYLSKGRQIYVEGRISTRKYTDKKTGQDRYSTEVVAQKVTFLGAGGKPVEANNEQPDTPASDAPQGDEPAPDTKLDEAGQKDLLKKLSEGDATF